VDAVPDEAVAGYHPAQLFLPPVGQQMGFYDQCFPLAQRLPGTLQELMLEQPQFASCQATGLRTAIKYQVISTVAVSEQASAAANVSEQGKQRTQQKRIEAQRDQERRRYP